MEDLIARELSPDTALFAAVRGVTQADPAAQAEMRRQGVTGRSAGEAHGVVWETAAEMVAAKAAQAAAGEGAVAAGGRRGRLVVVLERRKRTKRRRK